MSEESHRPAGSPVSTQTLGMLDKGCSLIGMQQAIEEPALGSETQAGSGH